TNNQAESKKMAATKSYAEKSNPNSLGKQESQMNSDHNSNLLKLELILLQGWSFLLGSDGVSSGSGVEVVEWREEWGRWCCEGWREIRLQGEQ
nr:hypothetical protein [Tanacetum cinerariifolium]